MSAPKFPISLISLLPGLVLLFAIAFISETLSETVIAGGKHPIEPSALAVILGMIIQNFGLIPQKCKPGLQMSDRLLVLGIVFLGAGLQADQVVSQGVSILGIIISTMVLSFVLILSLGRLFGLTNTFSVLLASGTTICGTSAIAIIAPLIKSKDSETSYSIAVVAFFGLLAIFTYPLLGRWAEASDLAFGVFAGTAIHSTPQVVGAGFIFSDIAGQTATAVKLVRNCFMAPLALVLAVIYSRKNLNTESIGLARAFPWFLFGYFILAGISSAGHLSQVTITELTNAGKFLILIGMAGVGLNTVVSAFRELGVKPLLVGLLGSVIVAAISATLITAVL